MYGNGTALTRKQCDSYDEPEGPPLPARIGLRGFPEADYFNRDESLYFDVPPELETAGPAPNVTYMTGFGAADPVSTIVASALTSVFNRHPKDKERAAQAAQSLSAARNGDQSALNWIIGQMTGSADDFGKQVYTQAYNTLRSEGRIGSDGRTLVTTSALAPGAPSVVAVAPGAGGVPGSPNQVTPGTVVPTAAGLFGGGGLQTLALVGLGAFVLSKVAGGKRRRR